MGRFILSGHNIDDGITPMFSRGGGGGGSFATLPFNLQDNDLIYVGSLSVRFVLEFNNSTSILNHNTLANGAVTPLVPASPAQYRVDSPVGSGAYSIRLSEDNGPDPLIFGTNITSAWQVLNTTRQLRIARPASGATYDWIGRVQIALTADTGTVLADAEVRLRYQRP